MNRTTRATAAVALAAVMSLLSAGCESSDESSGSYWKTKDASSGAATDSGAAAAVEGDSSATGDATGVAADQISPGALSWSFGGVNGGRAVQTSAAIAGLSAGSNGMSYRWAGDTLRSWGLSDGDAGAMACFFVQRSDGSWVGGKFDWISTSRTTRGFENIYAGYGGWSLAGVPNPCACAFVIVSADGRKRTNIITGTWRR